MGFYIRKYGLIVGIVGLGVLFWFLTNDKQEKHTNNLLIENEQATEQLSATNSDKFINDSEQKNDSPQIIVDVKGEVKKPGVYQMDEATRITDAIDKAGGFTKQANLLQVNLAQKLQDEMIVYIPSVMDDDIENDQMIASSATATTSAVSVDGLRINLATVEEIQTLNGIGPSKATAIFQFREENGPFKQVEDLLQVNGIGEKTLDNIRDYIIIP